MNDLKSVMSTQGRQQLVTFYSPSSTCIAVNSQGAVWILQRRSLKCARLANSVVSFVGQARIIYKEVNFSTSFVVALRSYRLLNCSIAHSLVLPTPKITRSDT